MSELRLLRSDGLGVPHAFTTRHSGVSGGMFASLNFGNPSDLSAAERDPPPNIRANFEIVLGAIGCEGREIVEVHQVHGGLVHEVRRGGPAHPTSHDSKADALVTDDPARVLVIRVADCAPVLLASEDGRVVGAAHAGWRGVVGGVVPNTVRAMRDLGAGEIVAAVGPCISAAHFEVGPEVAAEFNRSFGGALGVVCERAGARPTVDLKRAIVLHLQAAGVRRVEALPQCTFAESGHFFSHRREKGRTGRMIGVIGPNNPAS